MPVQRKDQSLKSTTVTVDRALYDEVISRGYSFSEIVNTALSAVLLTDDEMSIRYDALTKMKSSLMAKARAERLTIVEDKKSSTESEEQSVSDIIDDLCAEYLSRPDSERNYTKRKFANGEQHEAFVAFVEKTHKCDLSKRSELAYYSVVEANGQRVKALPLFKTRLKKIAV